MTENELVVSYVPRGTAEEERVVDPAYIRSPELLAASESQLLVVDVQERLVPAIPVGETVVDNCRRLIQGAAIFDVPIVVTEQYPDGLGRTAVPLLTVEVETYEKLRFSSAEALNWPGAGESNRQQIVVAGLETHVCVQQTVLDLLARGYAVFVTADAVGSRRKSDWKTALGRMAASGATITTSESVLFEWCEEAGTEQFQQLRKLLVPTSSL